MAYFLREFFDAEEVYDSTPKKFSISKEKGSLWIPGTQATNN
jgi:hypothetical protein